MGADVFIYSRFDGALGIAANSTNILGETTGGQRYDVITDFEPGVDKIGVVVSSLPANTLNSPDDILLPVQTGVAVDSDILPNGAFLFAYELSGSTYLIYDENSKNAPEPDPDPLLPDAGTDSRIWAKLQGVTGLGSLNPNDFVFLP